jgi:hypothetical protein
MTPATLHPDRRAYDEPISTDRDVTDAPAYGEPGFEGLVFAAGCVLGSLVIYTTVVLIGIGG